MKKVRSLLNLDLYLSLHGCGGVRLEWVPEGRASGLKPLTSNVSRLLVVLVGLCIALASCASNVEIINETPSGGTVVYPYIEEQDVLTSQERRDAIRLLSEKCPAGYRISREGEVPRVDQAVDRAWMGQVSRDGLVSRERRWAIIFTCK